MIHPNKEALTNLYDGREQIQMGIPLELVGILFHTLCAATDAVGAFWCPIRSARWRVEPSTLIETVSSTEPSNSMKLNDVEKEIGIQIGIYCQWWFSVLWFDGGKGANRMTYAFPASRLAWDPSALVEFWRRRTTGWPSYWWFAQHFGGRKQIILETNFLQNK